MSETGEREPLELRPALEAVLLVAEEPLAHLRLAQVVGHPPGDVENALRVLAAEYDEHRRGFQLLEVARGWRLFTREEFSAAVEDFVREDHQAKLSQAALETLAIVAYQQPVSRSRIAAVRGVSVDAVVRNLVTRGLLDETATDPRTGAVLYATSDYFLERMGLTSLDELPELAPLLPALDELDETSSEHEQSQAVAPSVQDPGGE